ncbi:10979_t:CDS:2 [Cetraspora pellucida]|uniref:10979_t:CDS:1 n=1 Tax=Cetraspora pellucida TaxID=1433469 RepID=A0ACA9KKP6_9GLOM|nr:10979_t:CDS:2 [Cetraspora pellucida]
MNQIEESKIEGIELEESQIKENQAEDVIYNDMLQKCKKEQLEDDKQDKYRFDWMLLAEIGSNSIPDHSSDLGFCNMD